MTAKLATGFNTSGRMALAAVAFAFCQAFLIGAAQAACQTWNVGGAWSAEQGTFLLTFKLQQSGTSFKGSASQMSIKFGSHPTYSGVADGTVNGNTFEMNVYWSSGGAHGLYRGTISPAGRISGITTNQSGPGRDQWHSVETMACADQPSGPAQPPKVIKLGKKKKTDAATCVTGYVWRVARPQDLVCVTPSSRDLVARENATAAGKVDPAGAYGPNTCKAGFVWREAYSGDLVCVTPDRRAAVRAENTAGPGLRAGQ